MHFLFMVFLVEVKLSFFNNVGGNSRMRQLLSYFIYLFCLFYFSSKEHQNYSLAYIILFAFKWFK